MKVLLPSKWSDELFSYWYKKAFSVLLKNRYDTKFYVTDPKHALLLDHDLEMALEISHVDDRASSKITSVKLVVTVRVSKDNSFVSKSEFCLMDSSGEQPFYRLIAGTDTGFSEYVLRIIQTCIIDSMSYIMKAAGGGPDCKPLVVSECKELVTEFPEGVELYQLYAQDDEDAAKRFSEFLGDAFIRQKPMVRCSILDKLGVVNFSYMTSTKVQYKIIKYPLTADWSEQIFFTLVNVSETMFMCTLQNSKDPFVFADISINITRSGITCFVRYKQDAECIDAAEEISQFGKVFHRWFTETFEKFVFHMIIKRDPSVLAH